MDLRNPKEGVIFGGLPQGWSLKRALPGEGPPLGTLRVGFGMRRVKPEHGMGH